LRDSELKKQLSEQEIHRVFFGELDDLTRDEASQELDPEILFMQGEMELEKELIAAKVGTEFIIIPKSYLSHIELDEDERTTLIDNTEYQNQKRKTYEDSRKIEIFIEEESYET